MALIIYITNSNTFVPMGIKAQMGHMAEWIELVKEKVKQIEPD